MKLTTEDIQQTIDEQKKMLEDYPHYRESLDEDKSKSVAECIEDADIEGDEFNIGFEQGVLQGMKILLDMSKETIL